MMLKTCVFISISNIPTQAIMNMCIASKRQGKPHLASSIKDILHCQQYDSIDEPSIVSLYDNNLMMKTLKLSASC